MNYSLETILSTRYVNGCTTQNYEDNPSHPALVSEEVYKIFRLFFLGFILLILCLVGITTNALSCFVFHRQGLRDRMNFCLFYLSLVDIGWLIFTVPFSIVPIFIYLSLFGLTDEHYFTICLYTIGVAYAFRAISGCYNMVIAIERCVCVMFPLHATSLIRTRTMGIILAFIAVILQVGFLSLPFRYQVARAEGDGNFWHLGLSPVGEKYRLLLDFIFLQFLGVILPLATFIIVSLATLITVLKLRLAVKWRQRTSSNGSDNQRQQMALTKTLVLVSCVYIVTTTPFAASKIFSLLFVDFALAGPYARAYDMVMHVANCASVVNTCVNFFVYCSRSSRFKRDLKSACACFPHQAGTSSKSVTKTESLHSVTN